MSAYILRRLLLIVPTLFGILLLNFVIVQAAPGGPVEMMIAKLEGLEVSATRRVDGTARGESVSSQSTQWSDYQSRSGLDPELVREIERRYGFDKPPHQRFLKLVTDYAQLDFGDSFYRDTSVVELILEKMPVSISLGLWSTLLIYLISIPLGIRKAIRHGSRFDLWTSTLITTGYAVPPFLLALLLIVLFAGGSYWDIFPLRGLTSGNFEQLSLTGKIRDYLWHLTLPLTCVVVGGFATLTLLTKNSFLDEIHRQYVQTARAKGLDENQILYGHIFRNAMLLVISGFPAALLAVFFTNSLLIEIAFSLDGLGLLGYQSAINRDYPVVFGTLFIFTLIGMLVKLLGDLAYTLADPRIDFEGHH